MLSGQLLNLSQIGGQISLSSEPWFVSHYRNKDQVEVDFVLESPLRTVIGIEVKVAATVSATDFRGLRRLHDLTGSQFMTGLVLYDGTLPLPFGDRLWAILLAWL